MTTEMPPGLVELERFVGAYLDDLTFGRDATLSLDALRQHFVYGIARAAASVGHKRVSPCCVDEARRFLDATASPAPEPTPGLRTRVEVFVNGHKALEVTDTEPPEPDLQCVLVEAVKRAMIEAPTCEDHDHSG